MKDSKTINKRQWHELEQAAKTLGVKESVVLAAIEAVGNDREAVYAYVRMDTTQQTLMSLPEPYRSQALANVDKGFAGYSNNENQLYLALQNAFLWKRTKEGDAYWMRLRDVAFDLGTAYTPEKLLEKLNEGKEGEENGNS